MFPSANLDLEINNTTVRLFTFVPPPEPLPAYFEIPLAGPSGNQFANIGAESLWIAGLDQEGQLKLSASNVMGNRRDFSPGPLDQNGEFDESMCAEFDRFWEVDGHDINLLIGQFANSGSDCPILNTNQIPYSVLNWPGRNNPHIDDIPMDKDLAPFYDCNGDDIYDPTRGDYPVIDPEVEGVFADKMVWSIESDLHEFDNSFSPGPGLGLELSSLVFAFETNNTINNSVFVKRTIRNVSSQSYQDVYVGNYVRAFGDRYFACDTENDLAVLYNSTAYDEQSDYQGLAPVLGIDLIRTPLDADLNEIGMSSFVVTQNIWNTNNSTTEENLYNLLQGKWEDGSAITFGGDGTMGTEATTFMYPSDPSLSGSVEDGVWSQCTEANFVRTNFLQSSGPFSFESGETIHFDYAIVFADSVGSCADGLNFDEIIDASEKVQLLEDDNFQTTQLTGMENLSEIEFGYSIFSEYISVTGLLNQELIQLISLDGVVLCDSEIHDSNSREIETASLKSGVYLLRIIDAKNARQKTLKIFIE